MGKVKRSSTIKKLVVIESVSFPLPSMPSKWIKLRDKPKTSPDIFPDLGDKKQYPDYMAINIHQE